MKITKERSLGRMTVSQVEGYTTGNNEKHPTRCNMDKYTLSVKKYTKICPCSQEPYWNFLGILFFILE